MYTLSETERIALVAENSFNPVIITDTEHKIVWVNEAFALLTGYTLEESSGKTPAFLHSKNTDQERVKYINERLERQEKVCDELLNKSKDGREYWVRFCVSPVYIGARFAGYISIENDITAERNLMEQLRESELKYKAIFNSNDDWYVFLDKNYTIKAFNNKVKNKLKERFGVDLLEGVDYRQYLFSDQLKEIVTHIFERAFEGIESSLDEGISLPDETKIWFEIKAAPVYGDDGEIMGCALSWSEKTKEKALASQLADSELKYKAIIDSTEDRHVLIDNNNKILAFNKSALKNLAVSFGFEMKEGDDFVEYFKEHEHVFKLNEGIARAQENESYTYESRVSSAIGDKWLRITYLPVNNAEGKGVGISINWSDITAQKESENKVLNQLNQLKEFSHITSHKLRQPLANIIGLTQLIAEEGTTTEEIPVLIQKLKRVASDLDDVINTMTLTVSLAGYNDGDAHKTKAPKTKIESIYIVDDDPVNNLITRRLLEKTLGNIKIDEFLDAPKALLKLKEGAGPDLILLDINMHPMDGWAFLNEFEKLNMPVPVIMCSSSVDPEDYTRAKTHPLVTDFLSKPLSADHIKDLVSQ